MCVSHLVLAVHQILLLHLLASLVFIHLLLVLSLHLLLLNSGIVAAHLKLIAAIVTGLCRHIGHELVGERRQGADFV